MAKLFPATDITPKKPKRNETWKTSEAHLNELKKREQLKMADRKERKKVASKSWEPIPVAMKKKEKNYNKKKKGKRINMNVWKNGIKFYEAWQKLKTPEGNHIGKKTYPELNKKQRFSLSTYRELAKENRKKYDNLADKEYALAKKAGETRDSKYIQKRKRRKKKSALNYKDYLRSPHWLTFRGGYRETSYYRTGCAVCGKPAYCVHHRHYGTLTKETYKDVMPLCRDCHTAMHGRDIGHSYTSKKLLKKQEKKLLPKPWEQQMVEIDRYSGTVDGK